MVKVLVVEDEPAFVEALEVALGQEGFTVCAAADGRAGVEAFRQERPALVLLDLMLPELAGRDVLRAIRAESGVPVIVLSAKDAEAEIVAALELGADDYLTKPYSVAELVARMRAALRRSGDGVDDAVVVVGNAVLDAGRYQLRLGDETIDLPRKEFEVLDELMRRAGRVVTRDELLEHIWGYTWTDSKTLDQHVRRIRRKLERVADAPRITTIRGVGYRLDP